MPPWPLLDAALSSGRFDYALRIARQWESPLPLKESARLLYLAANAEDGDGEWFERAAVRWLSRFASETRGASLTMCIAAAHSLNRLDTQEGALEELLALVAAK